MQYTTPNTLTSNTRCRSSGVSSRIVFTWAMPALATITSTLPSSAAVRSTMANTAARSVDVRGHGQRTAARLGDLGGDGLGGRLVDVVDGDGVPVAGQAQRDPAADPPARPR